MPFDGGCRCGKVRYTLDFAEKPAIYACHCLYCQTMTGSICVLQAPIPIARYRLHASSAALDAEAALYTDFHFPRSDGATSIQRFCAVCHTRIYSTRDNRPQDQIYLRAGTLDDSRLTPLYHIMTAEKQPWVVIPADVESFEDELPDAQRANIVKLNLDAP